MPTTATSALDLLWDTLSPWDLTINVIMAAAIEDGFTAAAAEAYAQETMEAEEQAMREQQEDEIRSEQAYEYWLETRFADQMAAEPWWAR